MTYSLEFRQQVLRVQALKKLSFQETATQFGIGIATLNRWHKRIEARQAGCPRPKRKKIDEAALLWDIEHYPDAYHYERAKRFGVSPKSIWRVLKKLGVSYKKTLKHPKASELVHTIFRRTIQVHKAANTPIAYINESGFAVDMPQTHGYVPKGQRCIGKQEWYAKGRIDVIGALLGELLLTTTLFNCNVNSEVFHCWVVEELLPKLQAKSAIVMDNASFHKRKEIHQQIVTAGHTLDFLPAYSPDLNLLNTNGFRLRA